MEEKKRGTKVEGKQSKKIGFIIAIAVIAVILIAAVVVTIVTRSTPKSTVEGLFNALQKGDMEKANTYIEQGVGEAEIDSLITAGEEENKESTTEQAKILFGSLQWKINNVTEEGDKATVEMEVTNKDVSKAFSSYMQKVIALAFSGTEVTEEQNTQYLMDEIKNMTETATNTSTVTVQKVEGKWKVVADDSLFSTLLPGMTEIIDSLSDM